MWLGSDVKTWKVWLPCLQNWCFLVSLILNEVLVIQNVCIFREISIYCCIMTCLIFLNTANLFTTNDWQIIICFYEDWSLTEVHLSSPPSGVLCFPKNDASAEEEREQKFDTKNCRFLANFFWWCCWGWNLGPYTCQAGTLLLNYIPGPG